MKKWLLTVMAFASLAQAEMVQNTVYVCSDNSLTVEMEIMDGGQIGRFGTIIMFNIKGGLYAGTGSNCSKIYAITYPSIDKIEIGGENLLKYNLNCIKAKEI